jgi:hypothetical protein
MQNFVLKVSRDELVNLRSSPTVVLGWSNDMDRK